ncbi:MAG TPA: DUF202 domain-containing protein [Rhodothermales bacterium]
MPQDQLRDELALERTRLANERTLLSYLRTALALAAAGAAVLHVYPGAIPVLVAAWTLIGFGVMAAVTGFRRFRDVRRRIEAME